MLKKDTMQLYNVNTVDYLQSSEFKDISNFISTLRDQREAGLLSRYPEHKINPRCQKNQDISFSFVERNTPFFDIPCENLLHQGLDGWVDIIEWHYQLNCFLKGMYHRLEWSKLPNNNPDAFLQLVWKDWSTSNTQFSQLMEHAAELFTSLNLLDYHREFIYNSNINAVSLDDVRELFEALVHEGIFLKADGDLYKVYQGVELVDANTNVKRKYHSGQISKMDELHVRSTFKARTLPILQNLTTKLNFIPTDIAGFEGIWLVQKFGGQVWFIPQYLVFYNKRVYN
jgi:hypothetical protein